MANLLPITEPKLTWRMLWRSALKTPRRLAFICGLFVVSSIVALIIPLQIGAIIDAAQAGELTDFPWTNLSWILGAIFSGAVLERTWRYQAQILGSRLHQDLGIDVMDASLNLNAQTIEDAGSGDLLSRVTDDIESVRQVVTDGLPNMTYVLVYFMVLTTSLFIASPVMGLILVPMMVLLTALLKFFLPRIARKILVRTERASELTTAVTENVRGASTIRELHIQGARDEVLQQRNMDLYTSMINLVSLRANFWGLDGLVSYSPLVLSVVWGSYVVGQGWASWGNVAAASILVFNLRHVSDEFTFWLDRMREASITMGRIFGVIDLANQHIANRTAPTSAVFGELNENAPAVEVEAVNYGYTPERPVMKGINLTLAAGESLALIGRSGSGKTTLARLIAGSLTADTGEIRVLGQPVGNGLFPTSPAADARPRLLICTQEAHQFVGTIADNLSVVVPTATDQQMLDALHSVGADWAEPGQLHILLGEGGLELTRDQVQQLSLARIVLANPQVVILDESTTQLDLADARESLQAIMRGRAVIIISHDARIASLADRAVLLQDGEITVTGTPAEVFAMA